MEKLNQVKALIEASEADFKAFFEKGNKAAGVRVRNAMQKLKTLAQDIRTEVSEKKSEVK